MGSHIAVEDRWAVEDFAFHGSDQQSVIPSQFRNSELTHYGIEGQSTIQWMYACQFPLQSVQAQPMVFEKNRTSPLMLSNEKRQISAGFVPALYGTTIKDYGKSEIGSFDFHFIQGYDPSMAGPAPIAQRNQLLQENTLSYEPQQQFYPQSLPFAESLAFVKPLPSVHQTLNDHANCNRMAESDSPARRGSLDSNGDSLEMMHMAEHRDNTISAESIALPTELQFSEEGSEPYHCAGCQAHNPSMNHAHNQHQAKGDDVFSSTILDDTGFDFVAFLEDEDWEPGRFRDDQKK